MGTSVQPSLPPSSPAKTCKVCKKDVSQSKRVKDAHGAYYCHPCAASAKISPVPPHNRVTVNAGGPAAAKPAASPPVVDDPYSLALDPAEPVAAARPRVVAPMEESAAAPPKLPAKCPNCDTPVRTRSIMCVRCKRDLTQPESAALKAARKRGPGAVERFGNITGKVMRLGVILFVIAFIAFSSYGLYLMFGAPKGAFDSYPTTHEKVIRDFLTDIAEGTDKSYESAFFLVSFRARTVVNNPDEISQYKRLFARIHDDFVAKYGADWINSLQINSKPEDDFFSTDDLSVYTFKIKDHEYQISTQVQIAIDQTIGNLSSKKQTYQEDGKNHFGVIQIIQYPVDWRAKHHFVLP